MFNLKARSDASSLAAKIAAGQGTPADVAEHNRLAASSDDYATATRVLLGGALAVAIAGVLTYYLDTPRAESHVLVPTITGDSAGASWIQRF